MVTAGHVQRLAVGPQPGRTRRSAPRTRPRRRRGNRNRSRCSAPPLAPAGVDGDLLLLEVGGPDDLARKPRPPEGAGHGRALGGGVDLQAEQVAPHHGGGRGVSASMAARSSRLPASLPSAPPMGTADRRTDAGEDDLGHGFLLWVQWFPSPSHATRGPPPLPRRGEGLRAGEPSPLRGEGRVRGAAAMRPETRTPPPPLRPHHGPTQLSHTARPQ